MYKCKKIILVSLAVLGICFQATAALGMNDTNSLAPSEWLKANKDFKSFCSQTPIVESKKLFPDTYLKAKNIRKDFCEEKISEPAVLQTRIADLLIDLGRLFKESNSHTKLHNYASQYIEKGIGLAQFELITDPILAIVLESDESALRITGKILSQCNGSAQELDQQSDCKSALSEFKEIYNFAHGTLSQPLALKLVQHLDKLEGEWTSFYDKSKAQTIWEMAINGALFHKENKEHQFMPPPNMQIVFIHPSLVVENVSDAIDGEQTKEALMIEAIGLNWWKQDKWYIPTGASAIAVYSDRSESKDWGYGIAVYFESNFSIGIADHDGETGVFVSIDLLKLLQEKKAFVEEYRGKLDY